MTDYKLVPVEPTAEMVSAAEDAYMPFGDMELAIRMALLAAPDHIADARKKVGRPQIREVFLRNGVKIEPDRDDLPDYVYELVFELLDSVIQQAGTAIQYVAPAIQQAAPAVQGEPVGEVRFELGAPSSIFAELYSEALPSLAPGTKLYAAPQPAEQQPALTKYQPCGCVVCTCEHETQCQGCGAKHCGTHPVGQFHGPVYQQPAPDVEALVEALEAVVFYDEEVEDNDGNLMMHYSKMIRKVREALAAYRKQEPGHD